MTKLCPTVEYTSPWLVGRVFASDGGPASRVHVKLSREGVGGWRGVADEVLTGSDGLFYYCAQLVPKTQIRISTQLRNQGAHFTHLELGLPHETTVIRIDVPPPS
jgi:hypothetical protein